MSRFGTNFKAKKAEKEVPSFLASKLEGNTVEEPKEEGVPKTGIDDTILGEDVHSLKAEIDESVMASPYGDERPKSILSSENKKAKTVERSYVSPTSDAFEEVLDTPVRNEEEELVSRNKMIFIGILAAFLYAAFLGIGVHFTTIRDGVPQRITMEDRENASFLSELDPYISYIQEQHEIIVSSSDDYTAGMMSAEELSETMKQAKTALDSKKKELVDITPPQDYEEMKSKAIELYSVQMTYCDNVTAFLSNQSQRNLELAKQANKDYEDKAQEFFDIYNTK